MVKDKVDLQLKMGRKNSHSFIKKSCVKIVRKLCCWFD